MHDHSACVQLQDRLTSHAQTEMKIIINWLFLNKAKYSLIMYIMRELLKNKFQLIYWRGTHQIYSLKF